MTNNFSDENIASANELLHDLLGYGFIELKIGDKNILVPSEQILLFGQTKEDTKIEIKKISGYDFKRLIKILYFYLPKRVASWSILQLENSKYKDSYYDHASDNELLIASTSIIDWLANIDFLKSGYTVRLIDFLQKNLNVSELNSLENKFKTHSIIQKNGQPKQLKNINDFGQYIYEIRSEVVHNALLTGMYPYNLYLPEDSTGKIIQEQSRFIFQPKDFRKYLWQAIFNNLKLTLKLN